MIKIKQLAVGEHALSLTLLDSNSRIWFAVRDIEKGEIGGWHNDASAGAVSLSIDSRETTWVINPEGKIFSRQSPYQYALGSELPGWVDESLKDGAGNLIKATRIATGNHMNGNHLLKAIDEQKRLWTRTLPETGETSWSETGWQLDKSATDVKDIAAGYRTVDSYNVTHSGKLYRWQNGEWARLKLSVTKAKQEKLLRARPDKAVAFAAARTDSLEFWQSGLYYLTSKGYLRQPSGLRAHSGHVYFSDNTHKGADLAVIDQNDLWLVDKKGGLHRRLNKAVDQFWSDGQTSTTTVQGDKYYWTKIKGPEFKEATIYWVQPGDTFNQIATAHDLTSAELKAKNPQVQNIDRIDAGGKLNLR